VATPGDGAGSGEELVAEVVSDAGDVRADDDGLVVLQGESEDGGVAGGLVVVPGDDLATVVAGDLPELPDAGARAGESWPGGERRRRPRPPRVWMLVLVIVVAAPSSSNGISPRVGARK
jgi:hypothetical protein